MHKKIIKYLNKNLAIGKKVISFVVFRTDRIGDTVLSVQVAELLKKHYPDSKVAFVVRNYTKPILQNNPFVDDVISIDDFSQSELVAFLKAKKFDISISLFASKEAVFVPFLAKIPIRIGPMSKLRSVLFNIGIRQNRSASKKNEAEYNLDLLKPLGIDEICYPKIYLTETEKAFGKDYFVNLGLNETDKLVILHPGSGGSSKDWSLNKYFKLSKLLTLLISQNVKVFISGSEKELNLYREYLCKYELDKNCLMHKELDIRKFFALLARADLFVSNSTGPLHCAASLGIKTVSFYPPIKTCKSLRWGPFSEFEKNHFVFTPKVDECKKCTDECSHYLCMDMIEEHLVLAKISEMLK